MVTSGGFPSEWSATTRSIATETDRGIRAARTHDLDELVGAVESLGIDADAARIVHAHVVRELLETTYDDGLSSEDISDVLARTVADAGRWNAPADPSSVAVVLTGALGVSDDLGHHDGSGAAPSSAEIITAALLVAALLATTARVDHHAYLVRAVEEIRRAQTVEMP